MGDKVKNNLAFSKQIPCIYHSHCFLDYVIEIEILVQFHKNTIHVDVFHTNLYDSIVLYSSPWLTVGRDFIYDTMK